MAPYKSPLADPSVVQKITDNLSRLAIQSIEVEEGVDKAKRQAVEAAEKYQSDFDIMGKIPAFFDEFLTHLETQNRTARDVATKMSSIYEEFFMILGIIQTLTTKEEVLDIIEALNEILKVKNPLDETPVDGFRGVTNEFNYIWSLRVDEANHVIDVLRNATDIKKTIEELTAELQPVMQGGENVRKALRNYALHIHN